MEIPWENLVGKPWEIPWENHGNFHGNPWESSGYENHGKTHGKGPWEMNMGNACGKPTCDMCMG